jgi:hypothetical protein
MERVNGGTEVESEIIQVPAERGVTLFGTNNPVEVVEMAGKIATALSAVIEKQELFKEFMDKRGNKKKHILVDAWTLCGSMLGVFPICTWTRPTADGNGFEAHVEARLRDGSVVGAAEAMCSRSESNWSQRDDYALKSMAQTRATSKAMRLPLGFIVAMGGYSTTPAEEMLSEQADARDAKAPPSVPGPERRTVAKPAQIVGKVTTPRTARPTPIPESAETATITISEVKEIKRGEKDGKPWTMYAINGVNDAGVRFSSSTFSDDVMGDAMKLTGQRALVHFMQNGKYKNALAVSPAEIRDSVEVDPNDLLNEAAQG